MKILVSLLFLGLLPLTASAEDPAPTKPEERVEQVEKVPVVKDTIVVTATRSKRRLADVPISTTVIDEKDIELSSAATVDDLIRTVPGVNVPLGSSLSVSAGGQRFSMRGLGGSRALVLYDGVPIHDAYNGTIEWDKVSLDSIRQVEIVRGGSASLFGNYALGGAVNLLTRPVESNKFRIDLSRGSFDTTRAALTLDYMVNPSLGLRLSHYYLNSDGYYIAVDPGPADIPFWRDTAITELRADFRGSERTSGFAKLTWSDIETPRGTILTEIDRSIFDVATAIHHAVGRRGLFSATLFHKDADHREITSVYVDGGSSVYLSNDSKIPSTVTGGSVDWSTGRDGAISFLSAGFDVQDIEIEETRQSYAEDGTATDLHLVRGSQQFVGAFGQASWHPNDRLEILMSARLDYYKNSNGSETILGGSTTYYPETSTTQLDPRISFRYQLTDHSAMRGAVYRAFNAPKIRELYRNAQTGNTIILGNPNLEPETLVGGEAGWDLLTSRASYSITLYRSEIDAFVLRGPVEGQPDNVIQYRNVGKTRSQGIEAMVDVRLSPQWNATLGYAYADSTILSNPADPTLEGNQIPEVVPHIGTLGIRYRGVGGLGFDMRWRVLSKSYGEPENVRPAPAHQVLDLTVSKPVISWLSLYANGSNLLDDEYYYVLTPRTIRACQPRTITVGARIHLPGMAP